MKLGKFITAMSLVIATALGSSLTVSAAIPAADAENAIISEAMTQSATQTFDDNSVNSVDNEINTTYRVAYDSRSYQGSYVYIRFPSGLTVRCNYTGYSSGYYHYVGYFYA